MKRHTVILGAGATMAAIPNGDKYGKKSSVMSGLIEKLELCDVIAGVSLQTKSDNLEDIYSELVLRPECAEIVKELEARIYKYFSSLRIPDEPTVYDFLILSLTEKDVIATFNWDPLLIQAYVRCSNYTENLPHIFCLHGNVAVGFCKKDMEFGTLDSRCPKCGLRFPPTKLLYPVKDKNYTNDEYIRNCWEAVSEAIEESYMLTIFGYSAPSSDVKAVALLKDAWGDWKSRRLEEISIIDLIPENEILTKWKDFIYTHHYQYSNSFFDSYLGKFPRRSCETVFAMYCLNVSADGTRGFRPDMSWDEIEKMVGNLTRIEEETPPDKNYPLYYTANNFFR